MKNILKINTYTYIFILLCMLCGFIKNILIIFFICIIHELGHIFFIKLFKYKIIKIEIYPFGGYTLIEKNINSNINKDIIISFGGVIFQTILLILLYLFKNMFNIITYNLFIKYNLIIILFNLIPIIPLDGNRILNLIFDKIFSYTLSYKINGVVSILFLLLFIIYNYIYNIDNYLIISFLLYKMIMYIKEYKYCKNKFLLERIIYDIPYKKIDNHTNNINELKKEVLHFFKNNDKYIKEQDKIKKDYFKIEK